MTKTLLASLLGIGGLGAAEAATPTYTAAWILPEMVDAQVIYWAGHINSHGEIVGSRGTQGGFSMPFRWSPANGYEEIRDLPGGDRWAGASESNDSGLAVGTGSAETGLHAV